MSVFFIIIYYFLTKDPRLYVNKHFMALLYLSFCSSFDIQLEHKLTEAEVESLSKKKWRYKWDVPAAGMSKGKWAGTGECFIKVCLPFVNCTRCLFVLCMAWDTKWRYPALIPINFPLVEGGIGPAFLEDANFSS